MVKKTEKASVKFGISEYLRIRRYVMTRIMAYSCNTDEDPRIPSLQELSAKFKVSRPTVCKALKELINENYLIAKPGLGTYINPLYILEHDFRRKMPLVGLLLGDGLLVHIDIYYGEMFSGILRELVRIPCYVHQLSLSALSPDQVFDVIREESLDALCWIQPPQKLLPVVERLRVAGLPVVTCSADALTKEESRQKNDVYFGIEELGIHCGRELLRCNRKNIIFIGKEPPHRQFFNGLKKAFADQGVELNERLCLNLDSNTEHDLRHIFRLGIEADAIINPYIPYPQLAELLKSEQVDFEHKTLLVQNSINLCGAPFQSGWLYDFPMEELAVRTVQRVRAVLNGSKLADAPECLEMRLRKLGNFSEEQL